MEADKTRNKVDHPDHYQGKYECIELMRAMFGDEFTRCFCAGNSFKYRFRAGKKEGESAEKDLSKAEWYETYLMENFSVRSYPV